MKTKYLEKEIDRRFKICMKELSNLVTLYEAYGEKASDKRQKKFSDKMEKKYGKLVEEFDKRVDNLPD